MIRSGFVNLRIPIMLRRALTMIPALVVLAVGVNPTNALVFSQVVLSFGIPVALVPLVVMTSSRKIMGSHINGRALSAAAYLVTVAITGMNVYLIYQQFAG